MINKKCKMFFISIAFFRLAISTAYANEDLISLFPLNKYDQEVNTWIKSSDPDFDKSLLDSDAQKKRLDIFIDHYVGSLSPWNRNYINQIFRQQSPNNIKTIEQNIINSFNNKNQIPEQIGYGENFRPYSQEWIENIADNINLFQLDTLSYNENNRGITVDNLHARVLPTEEPHFYNHKIAGQGYPFDNLQMSSIWVGTPVYIIAETLDHAWSMVITPDLIGWVRSNGVARVNNAFINTWSNAVKIKFAAITQTGTNVLNDKKEYLFSAYVGSVFPVADTSTKNHIELMVPVMDANHQAEINMVAVSSETAAIMPITLTPHHFKNLIATLLNRPYGWGGMYFYNDCSAELKALLTPFGIWLPRHSSNQVNAGKMVDLSSASSEKRLSYLMENGQKFLTIVYIGGHILLYIGNYLNPNEPSSLMAMTYQNMWGLSPSPPNRRAIIGQSVFFPMLLQCPEDLSLRSLAAKKYFQISFLNQFPEERLNYKMFDLESLMYPEVNLSA